MKNKICKCGHDFEHHDFREEPCRFFKCTCKKFEVQEGCENCMVLHSPQNCLKNHSQQMKEKRLSSSVSLDATADTLSSKRWRDYDNLCIYSEKDIKEFIKKLNKKAKSLDEFDGTYEVASEMMRRYIQELAGEELLK